MGKRTLIQIRLDAETKRLIKQAADLRLCSMTELVIEGASRLAEEIIKDVGGDLPPQHFRRFWGIDMGREANLENFRKACELASKGGTFGYSDCGEFIAVVEQHERFRYKENRGYDELVRRAEAGDVDFVWGWFRLYMADYLKLVPSRHKQSFVKGVRKHTTFSFKFLKAADEMGLTLDEYWEQLDVKKETQAAERMGMTLGEYLDWLGATEGQE